MDGALNWLESGSVIDFLCDYNYLVPQLPYLSHEDNNTALLPNMRLLSVKSTDE